MDLHHSVLLPYAAADMFDLIEQAEHYPQFLPWCVGATIFERSDDWVAARLEFSYLKIGFGFETRNPKQRPDWLEVRLVKGPFRRFQGRWQLTPLAAAGCKIEFTLSFDIADRVLESLAAKAVNLVARAMVDAFVARAEKTLTPLSPAATPAPDPSPMPLPAAEAASPAPSVAPAQGSPPAQVQAGEVPTTAPPPGDSP